MLTLNAIDHMVFNVRDVEASAAWYERVLGMQRRDETSSSGSHRTSVMFGSNKINLRPVSASPDDWFTAQAPCFGSVDLCFLTEMPPGEVTKHFDECGVQVLSGPVDKSGARGTIRSVYVRDPDGNLIEVSSYPPA